MDWLKLLRQLADRTDKIALDFFRRVDLRVEYKKDNSPVTAADKNIEEYIRTVAARRVKSLRFYGEEFGHEEADLRLFIDPIDGTRNFVRGVPIFATLLAIEERGEIIAGLVSAPAINTRWWAARDAGAFVAEKNTGRRRQIAVSKVADLSKAQLFHSSLSGNEIRAKAKKQILRLIDATERQRGYGDFYQHVLTAQGSGEAALDPDARPYDLAPLKIIIEEAGGIFTSFQGRKTIFDGNAVSSNGLVQGEILKILRA